MTNQAHTPAFVNMLTGGHPNSLGYTLEVVAAVLTDPDRLEELYQCYGGTIAHLKRHEAGLPKAPRLAHTRPQSVDRHHFTDTTTLNTVDPRPALCNCSHHA